ncbi:xanthine dehydrogenase accessory protein XdhC [Mesorhizobium sp. Z1-4]|uniref:xanthine dehydrogenase accessory protein XdhC n=1 Tax=Mesorhizobium sp. Z1-4 TaxID=2448478 RepID=UPI000FD9A0E5|nr:xanthine dehydrogenase accessory protein XdhC [Mesorhizobium sp. Z1-4]
MSSILSGLQAFLAAHNAAALVEVDKAKGSTPREQGAWMLVSAEAIFGTIGGGQLEFLAIDKARELISLNQASGALDIPLGPEIGQCCGGRVALSISLMDDVKRADLLARAKAGDDERPHVYLFGGGHVGHALATALELLPLKVGVVETRAKALEGLPDSVVARLAAVPEDAVREAPAGSAFVVLTHDHALDFLIVAEALKRDDAAYVGMIGSKTKRETFRRWYLKEGGGSDADAARLVCPIGGSDIVDKRPAVIAALSVAEIVRALG